MPPSMIDRPALFEEEWTMTVLIPTFKPKSCEDWYYYY
jgi:hypothetical protein